MPDPAHDEDAVRRLLAEARGEEPLPPEVALRLDTLLGRLVEARSAESGVHSIGARRQRRRGLLLLAAAAAVVAGVVVPTVNQLGSRDDSTSSADAGASRAESSAGSVSTDSADPGGQTNDDAQLPAPPQSVAGVVALTRAGFESEVRRTQDSRTLAQPAPSATCEADPGASYGRGSLVGATYDGAPAVLAYRAPGGAGQRVDLLACGTATVIRTTLLPAS